jgi:hypothetical protein
VLVSLEKGMVIITPKQIIYERISFLREQINPNNKPQINSTFQLQIDAIRSLLLMTWKRLKP